MSTYPTLSNFVLFLCRCWLSQVFQFGLVGASEILASVSALEFFYSQAPASMRSVTQSLNLATTALGSFIVIPILLAVNSDPSKWCAVVVHRVPRF